MLKLFAACVPGLEPLLVDEVRRVLGRPAQGLHGGVSFEGDHAIWVRAHVELGLASHVLVRLDRFGARHFGQLERSAARVDWAGWLGDRAPWRVEAVSKKSRLYHTGGIVQRVESVVAQSLGRGPTHGEDPAVVIKARLLRDTCTLSLDGAGAPLHRRGWRLQTAKAPLREDLARALVTVAGWTPGRALLDPMMGAATIVIEAATMARGLSPGRMRGFAASGTPRWRLEVEHEARMRDRADLELGPLGIFGRDKDTGALTAAHGNADRAGVLDDLDLGLADVRDGVPKGFDPRSGVVVCNPPYGRRVGGPARQLAPVFAGLGEVIRALGPGGSAAVLVPDHRLLDPTGLEFESRLETRHGGIDVAALVTKGLPKSSDASDRG